MVRTPDYRVPLYTISSILIVGLMQTAQAVFVPLALSLLAIAVVWPLQAWLQRFLPKLLALLVSLIVMIIVVVAVASAVAWGFGKLIQWLLTNASELQAFYLAWAEWVEEHGVAVIGPLSQRYNVGWLIGVMQSLLGRLNGVVGYGVLVVVFVMLGLLEVDDFSKRLRAPELGSTGDNLLTASVAVGKKLRRYMLVRTFASVLTGIVVWVFALFAGLELAAAWGAIAFALNYIPFLGPLIATVFPTLFAVVQFDSWHMAIVIFIGLNFVQFVIGSYLEPRLTGASLAISPFAVVFAVFFGSFLWGVAGAFVGVPMLIAVMIYCQSQSTTKWIATLLSTGSSSDVTNETDVFDRD